MFCTNCGKENKDTDLFCKYCGTPLKKPQLTNQSTTPEQQPAPKPAPEQQSDSKPIQQATFEPAQQPASEPTQQAASTQQPIPTPEATTPLQPAVLSSTTADETQPQTQVHPQHQKQSRTKKPMKTGTKIAIFAIVAILAGIIIGGTAFAIAQGYMNSQKKHPMRALRTPKTLKNLLKKMTKTPSRPSRTNPQTLKSASSTRTTLATSMRIGCLPAPLTA